MSISKIKEKNLADTKISSSKVEKADIINNDTDQSSSSKAKKSSFIGSTIQELKKVNWPSLGYVLRWSGVVVLFTTFLAITLGFSDHIFSSSVSFVDCSSSAGQNRQIGECSQEFLQRVLFVS